MASLKLELVSPPNEPSAVRAELVDGSEVDVKVYDVARRFAIKADGREISVTPITRWSDVAPTLQAEFDFED